MGSPHVVQQVFSFFDIEVRGLGLEMNVKKTEVQATGNAPHFSVRTASKATLSTFDNSTTQPKTVYKYLGVYLFTGEKRTNLLSYLINELNSFFSRLRSLRLTFSELIKLVNLQLLPTLVYRSIAHPLSTKIWQPLTSNYGQR